jgi:D-alanine--D-alanine ligase
MKVGLLCGGPSLERGISLNSARSVLDHLADDNVEIVPVYFDHNKNSYKILLSQLYSNTPSDFDFKLQQTSTPLTNNSLVKLLKEVDIVFPVMHGPFGEDGQIQAFLEKYKIPFIGSGSKECKRAFDKYNASQFIQSYGFSALPSIVLTIYARDHKKLVTDFFKTYKIKRAIVKPATGGSSIGVFSVNTIEEVLEKVETLFSKRMDTRVVVEPFAEGTEFTTIILQNRFGMPVAILPTEIETDYAEHQIFDFRKKYLPTRQVSYHCPPRFSNEVIEKIQVQAEQLFKILGMKDFARFDGWILKNGQICFSDFNPISGMEQNSFLFQQASRIGLTHHDTLKFILNRACERYNIKISHEEKKSDKNKKPVQVLFGGHTSERQVSLMSGTNVWLKLRKSKKYLPKPYLLDLNNNVWKLPYAFTLNHTVEEIIENCEKAKQIQKRLGFLEQKVALRLAFKEGECSETNILPAKISFNEFIKESNFIFIALHGGDGENGKIQKILKDHNVKYNGPDEKVSKLCMDKWDTNKFVSDLKINGISSTLGKVLDFSKTKKDSPKKTWETLQNELGAKTLIVKPRADGCSSGIVHLYSEQDLKKYIDFVVKHVTHIPKGTFKNQANIIEMPMEQPKTLLFEKFIETDVIRVKGNTLKHYKKSGWIEITVGVVEENHELKVLNPSITIAEGEVLSVEEKFQGGTGVNITPPPENIVNHKNLLRTKSLIKTVAEKIGITGYSRIDAFMQIETGNIMILEINTLPGLTPSTVLYHQGLAETPPVFPKELLEKFIENKDY